jgi:hypothetical protein
MNYKLLVIIYFWIPTQKKRKIKKIPEENQKIDSSEKKTQGHPENS